MPIIIAVAIAFLLRIIFFDTSYFFWDETIYIMNSQFIARGDAPYVMLYERPLIVSLLIVPFLKSEAALRIFMIILNCLSIPAIYFLALNFSRKVAHISAFLLAVFPFHIMASRWIMTDSISLLFITLTVGFYVYGIRKKFLYAYILGGVFLGISILTKFTNLLLLSILVLLFVFQKPELKKLIYSLFCSLLVFVPYLIFSRLYFGSFFYPIIKATHVIVESQPISISLVLWQILLFFGLLLALSIMGIFIKHKEKKLHYFIFTWFILALLYFLILSQKGIAKMPSVEWEMQRFLFPALIPALILTAIFLETLRLRLFIVILILTILLFIPSYIITSSPMLKFENGLREVSKEIGLYAREHLGNAGFYVATNYPVIAYYSKKKTSNNLSDLKDKKILYNISIEQINEPLGGDVIYHIERGSYRAKIIPLS